MTPPEDATMTTPRRILAVLAVVLGLLATSASVAAAQGAGDAYLRLAHLSPDTPNVDVYVASVADPGRSFVVPGVGYGAVSQYQALPVGSYVVSMRGAGAPADSPAVISASVDARPGGAYTVAGVGMSAALGLQVLTDKLEIPAPGKASVRVINGAVSAPSVDVGPQGNPSWASGVRFGTDTPYVDVPLGTWNLQVTSPDRTAVTLPCKLDVNSVYTVLLVDRNGALKAELLRDSTGSEVVPVGAVDTGFGGTAGAPAGSGAAVLVVGLLAVVAGGLLTARVAAGRPDVR